MFLIHIKSKVKNIFMVLQRVIDVEVADVLSSPQGWQRDYVTTKETLSILCMSCLKHVSGQES